LKKWSPAKRSGRDVAVGAENRRRLAGAVERRESLLLGLQVLDDRFDQDVAFRQVLEARGRREPRPRGVPVRGGELAFFHGLRQRAVDARDALAREVFGDLADDRAVSGLRRDLRNPRAHQARAEHANGVDLHGHPVLWSREPKAGAAS
jgi:hypothetical protein